MPDVHDQVAAYERAQRVKQAKDDLARLRAERDAWSARAARYRQDAREHRRCRRWVEALKSDTAAREARDRRDHYAAAVKAARG